MILLDTDAVSQLLRPQPPPRLVQQLRHIPLRDRFISAISVGELLCGLERSGRHQAIRARLEQEFIARIEVLPFDLSAAQRYALIKARLFAAGRSLDEPDLRIASIAIARGLTLITGNEAHFRRVRGLKVENWIKG
jgi:tRNA(fMet)-specific endonuclease VapC